MDGDLAQTPTAELCRTLAEQGATASLIVDGPDGPGTVRFEQGWIVEASSPRPVSRLADRLIGAGRLEAGALETLTAPPADTARELGAQLIDAGLVDADTVVAELRERVLDALLDITAWRFGTFHVEPTAGPVAPDTTTEHDAEGRTAVRLDVGEALAEVARRREEWDEIRQRLPEQDAVVAPRPTPASGAPLTPDEATVLDHLDGQRTLGELVTVLGYGEFELARVVHALDRLGLVEVQLPQDEVGSELEAALAEVTASEPPQEEAADHEPAPVLEPEPTPEPEPAAAASDPEPHAEPATAASDPEPDAEPTPVASDPDPTPADDAYGHPDSDEADEASEFLRELSRLAVEEPSPPPRPRGPGGTASRRTSPATGDDRRRKKGRFGRS